MFTSKNIYYILFVLTMIFISAYAGKRWKAFFEPKDEYDMIKNYLLTESPLYGFNKPKIWIHSKFEYNSRKWESFHSRSSYDLNQPYIHLTIRSIIEHCGDDFHICLIDDDTFSKLIPSWDLDLKNIAEPLKSQYREIGMAELVYYYGGLVLPNSFLCIHGCIDLYNQGTSGDKMFVCENVNHICNISSSQTNRLFVPDSFIFGAKKDNPTVKEYVEHLKKRTQTGFITEHSEFVGKSSHWFIQNIAQKKVNLINGLVVGVKDNEQQPILVDNLMEEEYLKLSGDCCGIYIPEDEILKRHKYQWFASMRAEDLLNTNMIIVKYMKKSLIDVGHKNQNSAHQEKNISSI